MKRPNQLFNCYLPSFRALPSLLHLSGHESVSRSGLPSGGSDDFRVPCLVSSILSTIVFEQWRPIHCSHGKKNARNTFEKGTIVHQFNGDWTFCIDSHRTGIFHARNIFDRTNIARKINNKFLKEFTSWRIFIIARDSIYLIYCYEKSSSRSLFLTFSLSLIIFFPCSYL